MAALRGLAQQKNLAFRRRFLGRELSVVTLKGNQPGITPALSDNFIKIEIATLCPPNRTMKVQVRRLTETGLFASL
jgi:hypothetical protein